MKKIGILAMQGAVEEHATALKKLSQLPILIKKKEQLEDIDAIIIPGGESTTITKLMIELNIFDELKKLIKQGLPALGTCAGLIILSKKVINSPLSTFDCIDIEVVRNAYGRQTASFRTNDYFNLQKIPMVFIRAPIIKKTDKDVVILSKVDNTIVSARQKNVMVTSFHPELTDDKVVYEYFFDMI